MEMPSTISTVHSKILIVPGVSDMNFQKLAKFLHFFSFFSSRCESYRKVNTGHPISMKFGIQKGADLGTKFR